MIHVSILNEMSGIYMWGKAAKCRSFTQRSVSPQNEDWGLRYQALMFNLP